MLQTLFSGIQVEHNQIENALTLKKGIRLLMARLDQVHPVISGNKLFKLYYFIEDALQSKFKRITTFGGAYSNHLVATAYACQQAGLESIGIVRGERPTVLSPTLQQCLEYKMQLQFVSREQYRTLTTIRTQENELKFNKTILIPEGGYHPTGARGAALINGQIKNINPTHICMAIGTATTLAGLLLEDNPSRQLVAVPVVKNMLDINERLLYLTGKENLKNLQILDEYHFGGYANKNNELISFMNELYRSYGIPTDFVYTAKMMYAVMDKIKQDHFPLGSTILCLHTGGLQGNKSLDAGSLIF